MVVVIVLALLFNTGESPRALFHLKLLLAEQERLAGAITLFSLPCHDLKIRPGQ